MTPLDRIKEVSKKRGFSLTQVNNKAHLGTNTIYSWKTKEPSFNNLQAVAKVLNVSVDYLLGKTDNITDSTKSYTHADLLDKDIILAFDGKDISESEKEKILDYARYVIAQREAKKNK